MNEEKQDQDAFEDFDWENRILCSDESCIGVIGPDGRCKECGKPYEGELPGSGPSTETARPQAPAREPESDEQPQPEPQPESADPIGPEDDDDWENRTLCSDESCIGVIGPDGRCKECGRPYEG